MLKRVVSLVVSVALACVVSLGTGCASTTQITSEPSGAEVRVDGQQVGHTPASFAEEQVWVWTSHNVVLKKKGYHQFSGTMAATVNAPMLILGIAGFFLCCFVGGVPALIGKFKPTYHYVLARKSAADEETEWVEAARISFAEAPVE